MACKSAGALLRRRILVVEDEYFLADDMAQALRKVGAEVLGPVPTAERGLALLSGAHIDAAILDINLGGGAVFSLARVLRDAGVPFVFTTGYDSDSVPERFMDVICWLKPFKADELVEALPNLLQK